MVFTSEYYLNESTHCDNINLCGRINFVKVVDGLKGTYNVDISRG
jgi:hypothetical protein